MRAVRVWFAKTGGAKYISHLDLNRCMLRAVSRARIPVWYTEGFNPHPYITFALPLSLGLESEAEPMDMRIEGEISDEEIKDALAKVMPVGIRVTDVKPVADDANEICYALYELELDFKTAGDAAAFRQQAETLVAQGGLTAQKTAKKGKGRIVKEIQLNDFIFRFEAQSSENRVTIQTVLSAGNTRNLNPALLLECFEKEIRIEIAYARIIRKGLLKTDFEPFR